ncbi:RluA family pseudouridine synthase [Acidocella sp.]|uniref:RluA family pseudouridine synthase n=1 Tax=Acidocella sp. TaxID=50710 RepID=UPI002607327A|nr:RNA pseudouridine synthase [Acidocella sp.]MDD2795497.1 RNA pseudouridine synthase [Acidocella sp.]
MTPPGVLYRDRRFIIVDKPAGLPVHAGRAGGPSVEDFFPPWRLGRDGPWLAHRLDQDTAGCLVIALKKAALLAAQACFAGGAAQKTYWAVVRGVPKALEGVVDLPLAKVTQGRAWKMAPDAAGQPALTHWRVMGQGVGMSWIEFSPKTGRTHQIRAHAAALGHPIAGDAVYGGGAGALHLLARRIVLPLEPELAAQAPVPTHMAAAMRACGYAAL